MINIKTKRTYLSLGVVIILLIVFNFLGWLNFIKQPVRQALIPFFTSTYNISIKAGDNYEFFQNRDLFFNAYRECQENSADQSINKSRIDILESENKILKDTLQFKEKFNINPIVARVIGKTMENISQTLIIDHGTNDNIVVGQPVIIGNGVLIGKIIKTESNISIVRLINDNQSKFAATVLNEERSLGVVEGGYGLSIKMNFIPRNETIRLNEVIITSGLEANIPRGLIIGTVTAIENETYRPFQAAILNPINQLSNLTVVAVLETKVI